MSLAPPPPHLPKPANRKKVIALSIVGGLIVLAILVPVGIAVFWRVSGDRIYSVPSPSMEPSIHANDRVRSVEVGRDAGLQRGAIVLFDNPNGKLDPSATVLIKRVVGVPGDTIESRNGQVYVNGQPLSEPYLAAGTATYNLEQTVVPLGSYYVMGDNRTNSFDSRKFGTIPASSVHHRAVQVIYPLSDLHSL